MNLYSFYTNTVEGLHTEYQESISSHESKLSKEPNARWWLGKYQSFVDLLEAIRDIPGPDKWGRDNHGRLDIVPCNDFEIRPQIEVEAEGVVGAKIRIYTVSFLLTKKHLPWEHCLSRTDSPEEAAKLIVDGLGRCDQELRSRNQHDLSEKVE